MWAAFVCVVGLGLTTSSLRGLLGVAITVDTILLVVLLAVSLTVIRPMADQETPPAQPVS